LGVAVLFWDNGYGATEWNIFLRGFFVGGVTFTILLSLGKSVANARS
jgi:hypothetical protein